MPHHHGFGMMPGMFMAGPILGLGTAAALGFVTIAALSLFCRSCGTRTVVARREYDGKCPNCRKGLYRRDVKRTVMRQQVSRPTPETETSPLGPVQILKNRLAKGELTPQEYEERLKLVNT